jgi:DNA (cytosine-5)-methyltransferase 1
MAGLEIYCGFDHDELAWLAYCQNFPSAESFRMDAADFPPKNFGRIDVMHFSPPCQVWSPAHTNAGKNDEANMDTLFTIGALLKSCNPRIATLEQTAGLVTHHRGYLQIVFNQFVGVGYSVRWRIEHLQEFGIPQRRKRLILVAAR